MDRTRNILRRLVAGAAILFLAAVITLQLPSVQTWMAHKAIEKLESKIDGTLRIGKVHIRPFNTIILSDIALIDNAPQYAQARDTLAFIGTLSAKYSLLDLFSDGHIQLEEVTIKDGCFNLVIEQPDSTGYQNNLKRMFRLPPSRISKGLPDRDLVRIKTVNFSHFSYGMQNYLKRLRKFPGHAIQWDDVLVTDLNATVKDFSINHLIWSGTLSHMDFKEKCGWKVKHMSSGEVHVGKGLSTINDFHLEDGLSQVDFNLKLHGRVTDYTNYNNAVRMEVDMKPSRWSGWTLARFIPVFSPDKDTYLDLEGHADGVVRNMYGRALRLTAEDRNASLVLDGRISNLPDYKNADVDVHVSELSFNTRDVFHIISHLMPQVKIKAAHKLSNTTAYYGNLALKGDLKQLNTSLDLAQSDGRLNLSATLQNLRKSSKNPILIDADIRSRDFNVGKVIGNPLLGRATLSTKAQAAIPRKVDIFTDIDARLDSLVVDGFEFKDHDYTGITGNVLMQDGDITADIISKSPDLDADITIWSDKYSYNGSAAIQKANLSAMNFDKRQVSDVGMNLYARMDKDIRHPNGNLNISDLRLTNAEGTTRPSNVAAEGVNNPDGTFTVNIESGALNGIFEGNLDQFECQVEMLNSMPLLDFIYPGLYVEKGSRAKLSLGRNQSIHGSLMSGRVAFKNNFIKDLNLDVDGTLDSLEATAVATNIRGANFNFGNNIANLTKNGKRYDLQYNFFNSDEEFRDGNITAALTLNSKKDFVVDIAPSSFCLNGGRWDMDSSRIEVKNQDITVRNFSLQSAEQYVKIDGCLSKTRQEELQANIANFDLSLIDNLWQKFNLGLTGRLNLDGTVYSPVVDGLPLMDMSAKLDSLSAAGVQMGTIYAKSDYNPSDDTFRISLNDKLYGHDVISASATIWPSDREIEAYASVEDFPIGWAQCFIPTVFSKMEGTVSGNVSLEGPFKRMRMRCNDGRINDAMMEVAFTKVPYTLEGGFTIDDKGIHLRNVTGQDRFGSKAAAYGSLEWKHMRRLRMNIGFDANNIEALNMTAPNQDGVFYGHVFGSGNVTFTGPFHRILMKGDVHSPMNSQLHIIVPNQHTAAKTNLLTFVDPYDMERDQYEQILEKFRKKERKANFETDLHCLVGTGLQMFIDIDNVGFAAGLSGVGNGEIRMTTRASEGFRIFGDYTIQEGTMGFNVTKLVKRTFNLRGGSSIKFGDNVFLSDLDIWGDYETKASISALVADNNSVENRRVVECGVHVTGKLENPNLDFSLNVPDLNPGIKSQVESELDTEDKVQKQFLSILIAGTFLPGDQGGVVNGSSVLSSNVSELIATQVNNIFNRLHIPLDLGLKYQPTDTGLNLFDVAVSTQLFHNRVIIGGVFGNRQNQGTTSGTEMFGDLDIEYKVNKSGTFRVKAFSHAADQYSNYLDNSQRNGVGLTWQQEFNKFSRWITNLFKKKEIREQNEAAEIMEGRKTKEIILDE